MSSTAFAYLKSTMNSIQRRWFSKTSSLCLGTAPATPLCADAFAIIAYL